MPRFIAFHPARFLILLRDLISERSMISLCRPQGSAEIRGVNYATRSVLAVQARADSRDETIATDSRADFASVRPDLPDGRVADLAVHPTLQKYLFSSLTQITFTTAPSRPTEGRIAIVTNAGRDALEAAALKRAHSVAGRAKPVSHW